MDWLKRDRAPITSKAWDEIDAKAKSVLSTVLRGWRVVGVTEPKGLDFPAVGLGRLLVPEDQPFEGIDFGVHHVQAMAEPRARFELNIWELDNVNRRFAFELMTRIDEIAGQGSPNGLRDICVDVL